MNAKRKRGRKRERERGKSNELPTRDFVTVARHKKEREREREKKLKCPKLTSLKKCFAGVFCISYCSRVTFIVEMKDAKLAQHEYTRHHAESVKVVQ